MDDGSPALEVGFQIDTGTSYQKVTQLGDAMDAAEAKVLANARRIEQATGGMVNLTGATSNVAAFSAAAAREMRAASSAINEVERAAGSLGRSSARTAAISFIGPAATREAAASAREIRNTEAAVSRMVLALDREAASAGKTRDELRDQKIETLALTAAQQGNTDAADRLLASARNLQAVRTSLAEDRFAAQEAAQAAALREQAAAQAAVNAQLLERTRLQAAIDRTNGTDRPRATDAGAGFSALAARAAEDEARAQSVAAAATRQAAEEHTRLAAAVQASHAAQMADAAAADRLRASTDPLYAATSRLNAEIAESTRLYHAGATAPAEYARQQAVLTGRLREAEAAHGAMATTARRGAGSLTQLSFQLNDVATMAAMGAPPLQIFASQAGQVFQVAQMAEGGLKGFARELAGFAVAAAPFIAVAAVAGVAVYRWKEQLNDDSGLKRYAAGLGLTQDEMKKLGSVTITTSDVIAGTWKTLQDGLGLAGSGKKLIDYLFSPNDAQQVMTFMAQIYGIFVGGYKGIVETWGLLPAALKDLFAQAVNAAAATIEAMVNKSISGINALASGANSVLRINLFGQIASVQIPRMVNEFAGAGKKAGGALGKNIAAETNAALTGMRGIIKSIGENTVSAAEKRLKAQVDKLKGDRTTKAPEKPKADGHADQLARDADATEAQIRNLYALAAAYGVSGAAALIAEARVKAESAAIRKNNAAIEEAVDRQIRLAIAQRVSDAAKSTAGHRDQARIQAEVNGMVAAGNVPAERAADLLRERLAALPLLAAAEAAEKEAAEAAAAGNLARQAQFVAAAKSARDALNDQHDAQERVNGAAMAAQFNADDAVASRQLALAQKELELVGQTEAVRERSLALLRATQDAEAKFGGQPGFVADAVTKQMQVYDATVAARMATQDLNDQLSFTADRWDLIARNVQNSAQGMADAFGDVGRAIGDMASIYAGYEADRARLQQQHDAAIKAAGTNQQRIERENAKFALASSTSQIGAFGDMASAAKGFFNEKSKGYAAIQAAEKAYRAVEFAMSVKSMIQDVAETVSSVTNSAARATAAGAEGVANQAKLPFPANIAAMAATAAALVAAGIAILGSGGSGHAAPVTNTGTGTVLGDPTAKSESIKNAIDALHEVDTLMLSSSRQMAASLRSIDDQISGFAAQILKAGDINANAGVQQGFKPNVIGSVLGAVPLVGGILKSLFGSTTKVIGSGLYGNAQSIGSILSGGFDASYYSDVEKKKKLFGITTSTKTSTKYTSADPTLENQFTLILRSFNDAISAAAGPLGESTAAIQQRLNSFVVNIGKIDLTGLTGDQITEKLTAVFGAAADQMAVGAFPEIARFQKAGEGAFETLVRVSSTVEAVTAALDELGAGARGLGIDAKLGLADRFDSVGDFTSAIDGYFQAFYMKEEQAAAKTAQLGRVFASLGLAMPDTLAGFRSLVEAQNLTTAAGQSTYATLLQLAPAFADLKASMDGARSAADILSERQDLERKLLEVRGNTAAIRALDLAKLDASNRALQEQIWAIQDAQDAAKAADDLRQAWTSVGNSIEDEIKRIRGLNDSVGGNSFAALMGQFNAATDAARGGNQDAAKSLPELSQALLNAAAEAATSRQELARVQAQTAASLEATRNAISSLTGAQDTTSTAAILAAAANTQAASTPAPANDDLAERVRELSEKVEQMSAANVAALAPIAASTGRVAKKLDDVTGASGGDAISVTSAAA